MNTFVNKVRQAFLYFAILSAVGSSVSAAPIIVGISQPEAVQDSDGVTTGYRVNAEIDPNGGEIASAYVQWTNPPAGFAVPTLLMELEKGATDPDTGITTYSGIVDVGFDVENRQLGAGDLSLQVVTYNEDVSDAGYITGDFTLQIAPLIEFNFPTDNYITGPINAGSLFASMRTNTNLGPINVTGRITGPGIIEEVVYNAIGVLIMAS